MSSACLHTFSGGGIADCNLSSRICVMVTTHPRHSRASPWNTTHSTLAVRFSFHLSTFLVSPSFQRRSDVISTLALVFLIFDIAKQESSEDDRIGRDKGKAHDLVVKRLYARERALKCAWKDVSRTLKGQRSTQKSIFLLTKRLVWKQKGGSQRKATIRGTLRK
jgi:hypothetical protein